MQWYFYINERLRCRACPAQIGSSGGGGGGFIEPGKTRGRRGKRPGGRPAGRAEASRKEGRKWTLPPPPPQFRNSHVFVCCLPGLPTIRRRRRRLKKVGRRDFGAARSRYRSFPDFVCRPLALCLGAYAYLVIEVTSSECVLSPLQIERARDATGLRSAMGTNV